MQRGQKRGASHCWCPGRALWHVQEWVRSRCLGRNRISRLAFRGDGWRADPRGEKEVSPWHAARAGCGCTCRRWLGAPRAQEERPRALQCGRMGHARRVPVDTSPKGKRGSPRVQRKWGQAPLAPGKAGPACTACGLFHLRVRGRNALWLLRAVWRMGGAGRGALGTFATRPCGVGSCGI